MTLRRRCQVTRGTTTYAASMDHFYIRQRLLKSIIDAPNELWNLSLSHCPRDSDFQFIPSGNIIRECELNLGVYFIPPMC